VSRGARQSPGATRGNGPTEETVLVTGAAGFIGHHLVAHLADRGTRVRGVDREPAPGTSRASEFRVLDLREPASCREAVEGVGRVYHLAAAPGQGSALRPLRSPVCRDNTPMHLHLLEAAREAGVQRILFPSSAAVYPPAGDGDVSAPLREEDAWPADPRPGAGLEKLYAEELCRYFREDFGLETTVVRLQQVHGPGAPYEGGSEGPVAALARRVAVTPDGGSLTVWGDGEETVPLLHVRDCVSGLLRAMESGLDGPLNLDAGQLMTVNEVLDLLRRAAGREIRVEHDRGKPSGGRGRALDATRAREELGWRPEVSPGEGLADTYRWIEERVRDSAADHRHPGPPHIP